MRDLFKYSVEFLLEIIIVIDYAKVWMVCPGIEHFLIEHTSNAEALFVRLLIALSVSSSGVVFLCTIGSRDEMEHSIVAGRELRCGGSYYLK